MTGKEAFNIWAPPGARWVEWARPVPFVAMNESPSLIPPVPFTVPSGYYLTGPQENTTVIIDLPGADSVGEGIALAKMGFRPIPLYNGTTPPKGAMALVDHHPIVRALAWGAEQLEKITIPRNAPPAFLLDSNRTHRYKMDAAVFDNSWDLYAQDMPSAECFLRGGINQIIVRGAAVQKDLAKILYPFQQLGIQVYFTSGYNAPQKILIKKPRNRRG